jgi:hypothetical protein
MPITGLTGRLEPTRPCDGGDVVGCRDGAVFVRKQRVRFAPDVALGADRFIGGAQKQGHVQLAMADCSPT